VVCDVNNQVPFDYPGLIVIGMKGVEAERNLRRLVL
jgi:hypothetical protein